MPPVDMPTLLMTAPSPLKFILPKKLPYEEEQLSPKSRETDASQNLPQTPPPVSLSQFHTGNTEDGLLPVSNQQPTQTQPKSARKTKQQKEAELALQVCFLSFFD